MRDFLEQINELFKHLKLHLLTLEILEPSNIIFRCLIVYEVEVNSLLHWAHLVSILEVGLSSRLKFLVLDTCLVQELSHFVRLAGRCWLLGLYCTWGGAIRYLLTILLIYAGYGHWLLLLDEQCVQRLHLFLLIDDETLVLSGISVGWICLIIVSLTMNGVEELVVASDQF